MNLAIILSGGTGSRLKSSIPKQYIEINGRLIIEYCLDAFAENDSVDAIQIVAAEDWRDYLQAYFASDLCKYGDKLRRKIRGFSNPGANRQLSIYHALTDAGEYVRDSDYVMIHDAARPLVKGEFVSRCFDCAKGHDGVIPVLPMKDTVYCSEDGKAITGLLERKSIFAGQAPEVFVFGKYYEANRALLPDDILSINGSTEPAILAGMDIAMIAGDEENYKITTDKDLERFGKSITENNI